MNKMDMNKMLQQVQQMQEEMAKAQDELANEIVEASVGGGMVKVKASGAGEIVEITGLSLPAVKGRIFRARRDLRAHLEAEEKGHEH